MVPKSLLFEAKAYLCWDLFDDLSIQLIPMHKATAYYFPPHNDRQSILLFYDDKSLDFSEALFLLFHEAGHVVQFKQPGGKADHDRCTQIPNGTERIAFEQRAWDAAALMLEKFLNKQRVESRALIGSLRRFSQSCIQSYAAPEE